MVDGWVALAYDPRDSVAMPGFGKNCPGQLQEGDPEACALADAW